MSAMREEFPSFFNDAPVIWMRDPLALFLGAAADGVLRYTYTDVVRLAGHSCPTVACAFLMTRAALRELYGKEMPERGGIHVDVSGPAQAGVTGVIASVVTLITGATVDTGFKGIAGNFVRRHLMEFDAEIDGELRFTNVKTGDTVVVSAHPQHVPADPRMMELFPLHIQGRATREQATLFGRLWQDRVRKILLEHADDPSVIECRRVG